MLVGRIQSAVRVLYLSPSFIPSPSCLVHALYLSPCYITSPLSKVHILYLSCTDGTSTVGVSLCETIFTNTSLNRLGLGVTPAGHELYVNTFVGFMLHILFTEMEASEVKLHISSFDFIQQKAALVLQSKRRGYTIRNRTTALCSYETACTKQ